MVENMDVFNFELSAEDWILLSLLCEKHIKWENRFKKDALAICQSILAITYYFCFAARVGISPTPFNTILGR